MPEKPHAERSVTDGTPIAQPPTIQDEQSPTAAGTTPPLRGPKPMVSGQRGTAAQWGVYLFVLVPLLALAAAVPFAWGWGLGWTDIAIAAFFYCLSGLGVTIGFHRYFTHGALRAVPPLRKSLVIAGQLAVQGPVIIWVADHRRHHAFSDKEGDPHSPWTYGTSIPALARGFWHAHMGWLFNRDYTNRERFAPDLLADESIARIDKYFWAWTLVSLGAPPVAGGLITWSWWGALTAFFWGGLVRVAVLHHITWSVNSICHMIGDKPFTARDKSGNFWPLAILSFGESWHNSHHADPTCARHGVLRGQVDISARVIWIFEKLGWAYKVRWPTKERLDRLRTKPNTTSPAR